MCFVPLCRNACVCDCRSTGFYKYRGFDTYELCEFLSPSARGVDGQDVSSAAEHERFMTMDFLLR